MPVHEEIPITSSFYNIAVLLCKAIWLSLWTFLGFTNPYQEPPQQQFTTTTSTNRTDFDSYKSKVIEARDINEIVEASGYKVREHVVTTRDGYLLVIHKLENPNSILNRANSSKVVYFHHGLMTNSELFVLGSTKLKTLPYLLVDLGYEVWLGNNRGNKYSRKHLKLAASDPKFWDFSLDEFAYYDIPDSLTYIKNYYETVVTNQIDPQIVYIGFSQGCSQLFASLSLYPHLNSQLRMFIGLSPAIIPQNLKHPIFKLIVNHTADDNSFLFSLFGRRAILPSVAFWSTVLGPSLYEKVVDVSLQLLFGWKGENISQMQKEIGYPHMFSNSSVKSLLHWFQIIKARRFQMFDETCTYGITKLAAFNKNLKSRGNRVAPFPIADHLNVPMLIFYGDNDILVDVDKTKNLIVDNNHKMKDKLEFVLCPGYEHMDTLWGENVYHDVFKTIIERLESMEVPKPIDGETLRGLIRDGEDDKLNGSDTNVNSLNSSFIITDKSPNGGGFINLRSVNGSFLSEKTTSGSYTNMEKVNGSFLNNDSNKESVVVPSW
ncbi:putative lipase C16A3.12c [Candida viswanathii]|uniref:Putative lipase C16A3.12c n=1 Tax=Candida viswanathii TaxID=5486 RepID=A0A367YEC8_9ASCO|nr:putative lipase C16A3.12c [Candida viswanathii]